MDTVTSSSDIITPVEIEMAGDSEVSSSSDVQMSVLDKARKGISPYVVMTSSAHGSFITQDVFDMRSLASLLLLTFGNEVYHRTQLVHADNPFHNICNLCGMVVTGTVCHTPCCAKTVCEDCISCVVKTSALIKIFNGEEFVMHKAERGTDIILSVVDLASALEYLFQRNANMRICNSYDDLETYLLPFCIFCEDTESDAMHDMTVLPQVNVGMVNFISHQLPTPNFTQAQVSYIGTVWRNITDIMDLDVDTPDIITTFLQAHGLYNYA